MKLSPLEIRNHPFKKVFRGYDADEVDNLLEMIALEVEALVRENKTAVENVERARFEVEKYEKLEKALQDTLIGSQKTYEETKERAEKEAELIIKEAEIRAENYAHDARVKLSELKGDIDSLRDLKQTFIVRFRNLLKTQQEMLSILEMDSHEIDVLRNDLDNVEFEDEEPELILNTEPIITEPDFKEELIHPVAENIAESLVDDIISEDKA